MTPSQLLQALPKRIQRRRAVMLWGSPGIGKTDVINQLGKQMNRRVVDFRLAMRDPTALQGFPMPDQKSKTMKFFHDSQLPTEGEGILFLDEINAAAQATQAAAMQLTLTGMIGDYVLPEGWSIVAAGNRESDRSVVHRMPSALSLRFIHIDVEHSLDDWTSWAIDNDISAEVLGFIRFRADMLNKFDPKERSSPTPRGWQFVDEIVKDEESKDIEMDLIKGVVGEGAAGEFIAYVDVARKLPTFEQIMLSPDKTEISENPSVQYALVTMLGMKVEANNMNRTMTFVNRMPTEMQVVFVRDAVRRRQEVCTQQSFIDWSLKNSKVLV